VNVLIVSTFAPPHVGGLEVVVEQQAKSLADMGHDVTVFTGRHNRSLAKDERVDGYRVVRTPVWNAIEDRTSVPYPIWGVRTLLPLFRLIRQADVVHVHDVYYQPTVLAAFFARLARRPLFVTQHVSVVQHDSAPVMWVQRLIYATVGALLWRWAKGIVAYNVIVRSFLLERGVPADKVHLTYNGIDTDIFRAADDVVRNSVRERYGLPPDKPIVLFVGRLVPKKGYRELVAAHDGGYEIVLAGPGAVPDELPSGVTFLGPIDRCDLLGLYQASDLFAFPAVGEMLTLSMQEAMACSLPVVAREDAAYDQYGLDESAISLVSADPDILRKTFNSILEDEDRYAKMASYSRHLATTRFDWRHNAADLADIYRASGLSDGPGYRTMDTDVAPLIGMIATEGEAC
jgi:glycosyltransferase involved in cell wall biosynthesis